MRRVLAGVVMAAALIFASIGAHAEAGFSAEDGNSLYAKCIDQAFYFYQGMCFDYIVGISHAMRSGTRILGSSACIPMSVTEGQLFKCAAKDCVLFMWTTVPYLAVAIDVLRLRGFRYVLNYAWGKDRFGTGHWNRNKHEHLLIGVRGNIPAPAPGTQWDSLIMAPAGEHSAKPECFLEMVESYYPTLPKIELNRRGPSRPGWHAWGFEAEAPDE